MSASRRGKPLEPVCVCVRAQKGCTARFIRLESTSLQVLTLCGRIPGTFYTPAQTLSVGRMQNFFMIQNVLNVIFIGI